MQRARAAAGSRSTYDRRTRRVMAGKPSSSEHRRRQGELLSESWGWSSSPGWRPVQVSGEDRQGFLQALLSQDLGRLAPGRGCLIGLLDRRGHLQMQVLVWGTSGRIILLAPEGGVPRLVDTLESHRVMASVEIRADNESEVWLLSGPGALGALEEIEGVSKDADRPGLACGWSWETDDGNESHVIRTRLTGELDFLIVTPRGSKLTERLPAGWRDHELDGETLEASRIEAGLPGWGAEIDGRRLSQELALDDIVCLSKGCYLGQETVARLTHRGSLRKILAGWRWDPAGANPAGGPVYAEGVEIGRITSA
ncbi:MAG: hypothetical protein GF355_05040, partial [Candidatus Eisenbacteria bacterium]|nr:hypothetical protein [Candidatus Eisenbacteria bacterium]